MNPEQSGRVVEIAATIWSNVRDNTVTREGWFLALAKTDFYDALDAIGALAGERKSIHVSDVVKRAARIRSLLLRDLPPLPSPPVELADDWEAETQWLKTCRERQLHAVRQHRHSVPA